MEDKRTICNPQKTEKSTRAERVSTIANIISSISVLIAAASVIIGMYPQIIWGNNDYHAKANAGDVYSQLFLAQHYYEIGEYKDAIYWYKTASSAKDNDYRAIACNNLGYLYAQGYDSLIMRTKASTGTKPLGSCFARLPRQGAKSAKQILSRY